MTREDRLEEITKWFGGEMAKGISQGLRDHGDCNIHELHGRLVRKVDGLRVTHVSHSPEEERIKLIIIHAAEIANLAMMLAAVAREIK